MNNDSQTKTDAAWNKLFSELDILNEIASDGSFVISAQQIKEVSGREPRLMAKFDHSSNLPKVFQDNHLSILPITRGDYIISHFDLYHNFETQDIEIKRMPLPDYLQSLNADNVFSETVALNCALASGILDDFLEDEEMQPTVSGRMKSGVFDFNVFNTETNKGFNVKVNNAQIEIDAAYEGVNSLTIFEAKRDISDDFLVRQLYYPYATWSKQIQKPVRPVFLVYSNGIYRIYEYSFENPNDYSSISLKKFGKYSIEKLDITTMDIQEVMDKTEIVEEPEIAFPQANDFERIVNLCELLNEHQTFNRTAVTENYAFDSRQTNYYTDAGRYLGLIKKDRVGSEIIYSLTENGKHLFQLGYRERQLEFCKQILKHNVFKMTLTQYFSDGNPPTTEQIVENMKKCSLYNIDSESTYVRRSSTIRGWINWVISLINAE